MMGSTVQESLPLTFSVASSRVSGTRYVVMWDGSRWCCSCEHYRRTGHDCRHILEKRLEMKTGSMFSGPVVEPLCDEVRLTCQSLRIFRLMVDGEWRTLGEIQGVTGDPQASISAQLRHFRKRRFGGHLVDKRRRGDDVVGLWEYRLTPNAGVRVSVE